MIFPCETVCVGGCIAKRKTFSSGKPYGDQPSLGGKNSDYVSLMFEGELWAAHRLSHHLNTHHIPRKPKTKTDGLVLHTCDNKWCINPEHLFLGTSKTNAKDNATRNKNWLLKRSEIQKTKGAPVVSAEARKAAGVKISLKTKSYWASKTQEEKNERAAKMRSAK